MYHNIKDFYHNIIIIIIIDNTVSLAVTLIYHKNSIMS